MNLTPHLQEKDIEGLRTEQVQKKKNEFHLVGEERRVFVLMAKSRFFTQCQKPQENLKFQETHYESITI